MGALGITNLEEFYTVLVEDFEDSCDNPSSSRHAMHCAISAYHMVDWVWADWLKSDEQTQKELGIKKDDREFRRWIDACCPHFSTVQGIANGSKHFKTSPEIKASVTGYGEGSYGIGSYGKGYLLIDWGEDMPIGERFLQASFVLEVVVRFWRDFLRLYRPNPDRTDSTYHSM